MTIFAILVTIQGIVVALFLWRPDLLRPGDIGTDASNYYAAALRLLDGHPLYALSLGDRPVPADNPPLWSVPLLSPPPIAVLWMPLAVLLPGAVAMYGWWFIGLIGTAVTATAAAWRQSRSAALASVLLAPAVAITAVSGNVNALLVPALALVFLLADRPQTRSVVVFAGAVAGLAAGVKLGPILVIWWLLVRGRLRAAMVALAVMGAVAVVSLVVVGASAFEDYLAISRDTVVLGSTPLSATAIATLLGAPPALAALAPIGCLAGAAVAAAMWRNHRTLGPLVVAAGVIYATPVVRFESLALLVAAFATTAPRRTLGVPARARLQKRAMLGLAAVSTCGLAAWVATAPHSWVTLRNAGSEPVIVRFGAAWQAATFGYRVEPESTVQAFGPLPGALTGSLVVYTVRCTQLATLEAPPSGGHISIRAGGMVEVEPTDPGAGAAADYDPACSGVGQ